MIRRKPRGAATPASAGAGLWAMLLDSEGFHGREFGNGGFDVRSARPASQAPAPAGLTVPPPPWQGKESELLPEIVESSPEQRPDALAQMKEDAGETELPEWGPPARVEPLAPLSFPEPDWESELAERAEQERLERERARKEQRAQLLQELLAEDTDAYPRKGKP